MEVELELSYSTGNLGSIPSQEPRKSAPAEPIDVTAADFVPNLEALRGIVGVLGLLEFRVGFIGP